MLFYKKDWKGDSTFLKCELYTQKALEMVSKTNENKVQVAGIYKTQPDTSKQNTAGRRETNTTELQSNEKN